MKQTTIIAIILGVLVLVSAVQAVQLSSLKSTIQEGGISISSVKAPLSASSGSTGASMPSSIQDLPQMVGGC